MVTIPAHKRTWLHLNTCYIRLCKLCSQFVTNIKLPTNYSKALQISTFPPLYNAGQLLYSCWRVKIINTSACNYHYQCSCLPGLFWCLGCCCGCRQHGQAKLATVTATVNNWKRQRISRCNYYHFCAFLSNLYATLKGFKHTSYQLARILVDCVAYVLLIQPHCCHNSINMIWFS